MAAPNDLLQSLIAMAYGAVGGALTTLVALRTRLAMMQRDIDDNRKATEGLAERIDARLSKMDRRQIVSLQVIADVARKVGADGRFSDQLVRFLASDADEEAPL
jgi:hypothetical protein